MISKAIDYLNKFDIKIKNKIGAGSNGHVYETENNKTIKISIIYDLNYDDSTVYDFYRVQSNINKLIKISPEAFVRVCKCNYLYSGQRDTSVGKQDYLYYFYLMEKLNNINEDEYKVFHTLISHEDKNIKKQYSEEEIDRIIIDMKTGLDFSIEKVKFFLQNLKQSEFIHNDLHPRNIMKDDSGNFKLIDIDNIQIKGETKWLK